MAKEIGISEFSVRKIVKGKLRLRSYKINRVHFLNDRIKTQRLQKCRKIKRLVAAGHLQRVLFTDEKIFTVQRHLNSQNNRQLFRKKGLVAKVIQRSLPPLCNSLGWHNLIRQDTIGLH